MPFDALHFWSANLPIAETPQFQRGKFDALQKLLPYAQNGSREAASVVLKLDGSEFDFAVGDLDSVESQVPVNQIVAHLHTHPEEWAHSEVDWSSFLLTKSVEQAHVITPLRTYSLHKPVNWRTPLVQSQRAVESRYLNELKRLIDLSFGWSRANETYWREEIARHLAQHYNIIFREGTRK